MIDSAGIECTAGGLRVSGALELLHVTLKSGHKALCSLEGLALEGEGKHVPCWSLVFSFTMSRNHLPPLKIQHPRTTCRDLTTRTKVLYNRHS